MAAQERREQFDELVRQIHLRRAAHRDDRSCQSESVGDRPVSDSNGPVSDSDLQSDGCLSDEQRRTLENRRRFREIRDGVEQRLSYREQLAAQAARRETEEAAARRQREFDDLVGRLQPRMERRSRFRELSEQVDRWVEQLDGETAGGNGDVAIEAGSEGILSDEQRRAIENRRRFRELRDGIDERLSDREQQAARAERLAARAARQAEEEQAARRRREFDDLFSRFEPGLAGMERRAQFRELTEQVDRLTEPDGEPDPERP